MTAYSVTLNGTNFLVDVDGGIQRLSFFTTREVEANSLEAAESAAVNTLTQSESLRQIVRNPPDDPPVIYVEEMIEIDAIDPYKDTPGLVWYAEPEAETQLEPDAD